MAVTHTLLIEKRREWLSHTQPVHTKSNIYLAPFNKERDRVTVTHAPKDSAFEFISRLGPLVDHLSRGQTLSVRSLSHIILCAICAAPKAIKHPIHSFIASLAQSLARSRASNQRIVYCCTLFICIIGRRRTQSQIRVSHTHTLPLLLGRARGDNFSQTAVRVTI